MTSRPFLAAVAALCLALPCAAQFKANVKIKTGVSGRIAAPLTTGVTSTPHSKIAPSVVTGLSFPVSPGADGVTVSPEATVSAALPASPVPVLDGSIGVPLGGAVQGSVDLSGEGGASGRAAAQLQKTDITESPRKDEIEDAGRWLFDGSVEREKPGILAGLFGKKKAVPKKALPLAPYRVETIGIDSEARRYSINGFEAEVLGIGSFKTSLIHPQAPHRTIKIFDSDFLDGPLSLRERNREVKNTVRLRRLGIVPKLIDVGWFRDGERYLGFVDEEIVDGLNLEVMTATKLGYVKRLFQILIQNGILLEDLELDNKLRLNIMVGKTASDDQYQAWIVDKDVTFTKMPKDELREHYTRALRMLTRGMSKTAAK